MVNKVDIDETVIQRPVRQLFDDYGGNAPHAKSSSRSFSRLPPLHINMEIDARSFTDGFKGAVSLSKVITKYQMKMYSIDV